MKAPFYRRMNTFLVEPGRLFFERKAGLQEVQSMQSKAALARDQRSPGEATIRSGSDKKKSAYFEP
jgi:hypothetical protein